MRTKRFLIMFTVLALLIALTTTAFAAPGFQPATPSLVGTWKMTIPTTGTSPELTEALQTYFADGNFIETNNTPAIGSTAHGVWIGTGNTYLNTFQVFTFDKEGKYDGKRVIHSSITMDGNDHYTAKYVTDSIDLTGKVTKNVFSGSLEGARLEPEMPELK